MKKFFVVFLAVAMLLTSLCIMASAKQYDDGETVYDIETAKTVTFSYEGTTSATVFPRGKSTINCLIDGDSANGVTAHNQDGIVLVCNDYIKPKYEENQKNGLSPAMTDQAPEDIPRYSFVIEYDETVKFDAVYISLFHEINACVATPGDNAVTVEYSKNGTDWTPAGTDGIYYYRAPDLSEYVMNETSHNSVVEERIVPLGKSYRGKYIRLTFNFMAVPETDAWRYYTNVYEWVGFTELGVGSYESGKKPVVLGKEEATVADVDVAGDWVSVGEDAVVYYSFASDGGNGYVYKEILASDYKESGITAESESFESGKYTVNGATVTLKPESGDEKVITVSLAEDKLTIDDGIETKDFEVYTNTAEPESSESDESTPESTPESEHVSDVDCAEPSETESKTESNAEVSTEPSASLATVDEDDGGIPVGVIVAIAAVIVVAVVAVVIIAVKKKNK